MGSFGLSTVADTRKDATDDNTNIPATKSSRITVKRSVHSGQGSHLANLHYRYLLDPRSSAARRQALEALRAPIEDMSSQQSWSQAAQPICVASSTAGTDGVNLKSLLSVADYICLME